MKSNNLLASRAVQYTLLGTGILFLLLLLRMFFRSNPPIPQPALPRSGNHLILDLDTSSTIGEIEPKQRALYGALYDSLFESERWGEILPPLSFNPRWKIQPQPASKNTVLRFKVWNEAGKEAVDVLFDPYGIMTGKPNESLWQVSAPGAKTIYVPMKDSTQLRAVIAATLQDVSPLEPENS